MRAGRLTRVAAGRRRDSPLICCRRAGEKKDQEERIRRDRVKQAAEQVGTTPRCSVDLLVACSPSARVHSGAPLRPLSASARLRPKTRCATACASIDCNPL